MLCICWRLFSTLPNLALKCSDVQSLVAAGYNSTRKVWSVILVVKGCLPVHRPQYKAKSCVIGIIYIENRQTPNKPSKKEVVEGIGLGVDVKST
jgi:hypothetical protein